MINRHLLGFSAMLLIAGCSNAALRADGTTPLPDGRYSFFENPENLPVRIAGKVMILGDSIAIEPEQACPTSYGSDRHSMTLSCNGYDIRVDNRDGKWILRYSGTATRPESKQECVDWTLLPSGSMQCKKWETARSDVRVPVTGGLRLFVVDTSHARANP